MKIVMDSKIKYTGIYEIYTLICPIAYGSTERSITDAKTFIVTFDDNGLEDFYARLRPQWGEDIVVTGMMRLSK